MMFSNPLAMLSLSWYLSYRRNKGKNWPKNIHEEGKTIALNRWKQRKGVRELPEKFGQGGKKNNR